MGLNQMYYIYIYGGLNKGVSIFLSFTFRVGLISLLCRNRVRGKMCPGDLLNVIICTIINVACNQRCETFILVIQ